MGVEGKMRKSMQENVFLISLGVAINKQNQFWIYF